MPTYVSLVTWTEQGIKNFPDTIRRAEEFTRFVQGSGGMVREVLWTVGEYDLVQISEFANEEKAIAAFLRLGSAVTSEPARCGPSTLKRWTRSLT